MKVVSQRYTVTPQGVIESPSHQVQQLQATSGAFAALCADGSASWIGWMGNVDVVLFLDG